jgi:hypothetical protein
MNFMTDYTQLAQKGFALVKQMETRIANSDDLRRLENILQIGCGPWQLTKTLESKYNITAIDHRENYVQTAKERGVAARVIHAQSHTIPQIVGDQKYELILALGILSEHQIQKDLEANTNPYWYTGREKPASAKEIALERTQNMLRDAKEHLPQSGYFIYMGQRDCEVSLPSEMFDREIFRVLENSSDLVVLQKK